MYYWRKSQPIHSYGKQIHNNNNKLNKAMIKCCFCASTNGWNCRNLKALQLNLYCTWNAILVVFFFCISSAASDDCIHFSEFCSAIAHSLLVDWLTFKCYFWLRPHRKYFSKTFWIYFKVWYMNLVHFSIMFESIWRKFDRSYRSTLSDIRINIFFNSNSESSVHFRVNTANKTKMGATYTVHTLETHLTIETWIIIELVY